ncbi:MAG: type I restriction-modification system subunit M N-terminal domain-containing protein [Vicinamibacterales bacterium]
MLSSPRLAPNRGLKAFNDTRNGGKGAAQPPLPAAPRTFNGFSEIASFIWSVADLLRGDYKQADYGKVILPFTVLRRLDCVLGDSKEKVLKRIDVLKGGAVKNVDPILNRLTGVPFHNVSRLDFGRLTGDSTHIAANLTAYVRRRGARDHGAVQVRRPGREAGRVEPGVPRRLEVRRRRPAPRQGSQPRDGVDLRRNSSGASRSSRTRRPASTSPPGR